MTKDVLLSIKGLQFDGKENTDISTIQAAQYYFKNGKHYVFYDETVEGSKEVVRNVIKFDEQEVEVNKKGIFQVQLLFEKKKQNLSNYRTPYGLLVIGTDTQKIGLTEEEREIDLKIEYDLEVNYQHLAECCIEIKICPEEDGKKLFQ